MVNIPKQYSARVMVALAKGQITSNVQSQDVATEMLSRVTEMGVSTSSNLTAISSNTSSLACDDMVS